MLGEHWSEESLQGAPRRGGGMSGGQESLEGAGPLGGQGEVEKVELLGEHLLHAAGREKGKGVLLEEVGGKEGGTDIRL